MKKIWRGTVCALGELVRAYRYDKSFRMELGWGSIFFLTFGYLVWPLEKVELFFLVFSFAFILLSELFNTALEIVLERLHPERHELIGAGKDIAAAAVFVAFLFTFFVCIMILLRYFGFIGLR